MALDPQAIHEAIADQIRGYIARSVNVYSIIPDEPRYPYVGVETATPYLSYYESFASPTVGALTDMNVELVIAQAPGEKISATIFILDLLSSGTGRTSSVIDAIEQDQSLGELVETCICRTATGITTNQAGAWEARVPMAIITRRT